MSLARALHGFKRTLVHQLSELDPITDADVDSDQRAEYDLVQAELSQRKTAWRALVDQAAALEVETIGLLARRTRLWEPAATPFPSLETIAAASVPTPRSMADARLLGWQGRKVNGKKKRSRNGKSRRAPQSDEDEDIDEDGRASCSTLPAADAHSSSREHYWRRCSVRRFQRKACDAFKYRRKVSSGADRRGGVRR